MSKKLFEQEFEKQLLEPLKNGYEEMDISEWWHYTKEKKSIEEYENFNY